MSRLKAFLVIRTAGENVGTVVREDGGFRFHAATHDLDRLDGDLFRSERDAEQAVLRAVAAERRARRHDRAEFR
jgi:hypothetical protein